MSDTSSGGRQASPKKRPKKNAKREDARASDGVGVLANLPRTRPQRASARRDAARLAAPETKAQPAASPAPKRRRTATAAATAKANATAKAKAKASPAPGQTSRRAATTAQIASAPQQVTAKARPAEAKRVAKPREDPAPRQGFETEGDPVSGPVQPPGGVDLFASAAELAGELTKTGLATGGRLLKDAFARLPLN